jgi:lysophospholipase L1-like esterase
MEKRKWIALLVVSLLWTVSLWGSQGTLALAGDPGKSMGLYRVTSEGELVRIWRDATKWQCRSIFTWGGAPVPDSLIAGGRGVVFGVNAAGMLYNTYFEGPAARYAPLQLPFTLAPGTLALGGEGEWNAGVFGLTPDGKLARAQWTGKPAWEFTIIPSWGPKIVAGSLIAADDRIYGVNADGQLVNTWISNGVHTFAVIEGRKDLVPRSLAVDGTPRSHQNVYAVNRQGQLVRAYWNNGWFFQTAAVDGGMTPYLVSSARGVLGITGKGQLVRATVVNGAISITNIGTVTGGLLPGSLTNGGPISATNDLYATDTQGRLVRVSYGGGKWSSAVVNGATVRPRSLIAGDAGIYGVDSANRTFAVAVANGVPSITYPCPVPSPGADRRALHTKVLREAYGIQDIASLGTLNLNGSVVLEPGLLRARGDLVAGTMQVKNARRADMAAKKFVPLVITASTLKFDPPPVAQATGLNVPLDVAYIAAKTLNIPDNTNLVVKYPNLNVVIMAEQANFGQNVTITYERPDATPDPQPLKPGKPATPAVPNPFSVGNRGANGTAGTAGMKGRSFGDRHAPEVELWVLGMSGAPAFDLRGQDGGVGSKGGDGGDGGNGSAGSPSKGNLVTCNYGPGSGGDGGAGGRAGDGGPGGDGANGGRLTLYAPQNVIAAYQAGFFITVDGGSAGPGGIPGTPGAGGAGGPVGAINGNACKKPASERVSGHAGAQGAAGVQGASGTAGVAQTPDPIRMLAIQPSDFIAAFEYPALESIDVPGTKSGSAFEGDVVTVHGQRFLDGDTILVEKAPGQWTPAVTTILGDKLLSFVVPAVPGGVRAIVLEQMSTAKQSNKLTFAVLPKVVDTTPSPRIRPGSEVIVNGSGFAPNMTVTLNQQPAGSLTYVDPNHVKYLVRRPSAGIASNAGGEPAALQLKLADGTAAAPINVILDTYEIAVVGDSVAWGVGLQEPLKYSGLVEQKVRDLNQQSNIGVYRGVEAHTGAKIGVGDTNGLPAIHGEVPTRYPTVLAQLDAYASRPTSQYVDLVLVTACINDIGIFTVMDPQVSTSALESKTTAACHDDLLAMLKRAGQVFPTAKVVATNYFHIFGPTSAGTRLVAFLIAIDHPLVKIPGEIVGGVLKPATSARVIQNTMTFHAKSTAEMQRAVNDANAHFGGAPRFFFADAKWGLQNAALTGLDPWLFGVNLDGSAEDLIAAERKTLCEQHKDRSDKLICTHASAGHPNVKGAQQIANAIYPFLQ